MVQCDCSLIWCFGCKLEGHYPATCEAIEWYNKQNNRSTRVTAEDNLATLNWLNKFTQDCPACKSPIEKNGGCNHMTCRTCGGHFCWVCRGQWTGGTHYSCSSPSDHTDRNLQTRFALFESTLSYTLSRV